MERQRATRRPLGQIIQEVFIERNNAWEVTLGALGPGVDSSELQQMKRRLAALESGPAPHKRQKSLLAIEDTPKGGPNKGNQKQGGGGNPVLAKQMKNGTALCPDFQTKAGCSTKGESCAKGAHKCAGLLKGQDGRVCGLDNHGGWACKRCKRA